MAALAGRNNVLAGTSLTAPDAGSCGFFRLESDQLCSAQHQRSRRSVPVTTISIARLPQRAHTSRSRRSRTAVPAPYFRPSRRGRARPGGHTLYITHTMSRTCAAAALPSVIGRPGSDFIAAQTECLGWGCRVGIFLGAIGWWGADISPRLVPMPRTVPPGGRSQRIAAGAEAGFRPLYTRLATPPACYALARSCRCLPSDPLTH
jgi:hypothetical protein